MTATGFALIAGGLATLICFRRVLWPGRRRDRTGGTQARPARTRPVEAAPRPDTESGPAECTVLPAQAGAPEISGAHRLPSAVDLDQDEPVVDTGRDDETGLPTGDYWMPVPESAYADLGSAGYDWPARDVRDRVVESEPTAVVPTWPPARPFDRIELPRTWSEGPSGRTLQEANWRPHQADAGRHWEQLDLDGRDGWPRDSALDEEHLTLRDGEPPRRCRPRPGPTVYVSRHAAE
jgi:hypothetical protein